MTEEVFVQHHPYELRKSVYRSGLRHKQGGGVHLVSSVPPPLFDTHRLRDQRLRILSLAYLRSPALCEIKSSRPLPFGTLAVRNPHVPPQEISCRTKMGTIQPVETQPELASIPPNLNS